MQWRHDKSKARRNDGEENGRRQKEKKNKEHMDAKE
jgi:hypothetical protein